MNVLRHKNNHPALVATSQQHLPALYSRLIREFFNGMWLLFAIVLRRETGPDVQKPNTREAPKCHAEPVQLSSMAFRTLLGNLHGISSSGALLYSKQL